MLGEFGGCKKGGINLWNDVLHVRKKSGFFRKRGLILLGIKNVLRFGKKDIIQHGNFVLMKIRSMVIQHQENYTADEDL